MTEGNWRLGVFVDDQASDEQFDKLVEVFSGQLGGPMAALAPLVGEMLGVERAAIEISDDGLRHSVRVGDGIDFEIEDIVPFGVETGRAGAVRRHVPPGRLGPDDGRGEAVADQRLRHPVRGQDRAVDVRVLLGRLTPMARRRRSGSTGSGLAPAFAAVRVRLGLVAALFALAAVGWWWTAGQMRGMDEGPWTGLGAFGWFLGVWVVMMAAMMFPSVAPTVALYSRMTKKRSPLSPLLFAAGYLLTWAAAGVWPPSRSRVVAEPDRRATSWPGTTPAGGSPGPPSSSRRSTSSPR